MVRRLALLLVTAFVAGALSGCSSERYVLTAVFDDVGDLQSRGAVQIANVRVGRIGSITLTDDFRAEVKLHMDGGVRVPAGSTALLRQTSLLGEKFVEVRWPADPSGDALGDGDRITRTGEAPELEFVAEQAMALLAGVTAEDVATLIATGAEGFGGRGDELQSLVEDLASISATLASRTSSITRIIDGFDTAAGELAGGTDHISALLDNLAATSQLLADNRTRAVHALEQLSRLAAVQNDVLDRYRADVDLQIRQVDEIVRIAVTQTAEVGQLLDWLARFTTVIPKVIPGDFTQVYMWVVPAQQDPRVDP